MASIDGANVVVHLGPEKTGTTALAEYFSLLAARGELNSRIIFPAGELWFNRADRIQKHNVELQALGHSFSHGGLTTEQISGLTRLREAALAQPGFTPTVVLIFELGLASSPPETLTECLLNFFDTVTYVVAARHQNSAIRSLISQRVSTRDHPAYALDLAAYRDSGALAFSALDYALVSRQWRGNDARVRLMFIPFFESDPGSMRLIQRFFAAAGLPEPVEGHRIAGRRIHPTLSAAGLTKLSAIKRQIHRWRWLPSVKNRLFIRFGNDWKLFHHSAIRGQIEPDGKMYRPWQLSETDRLWVLDQYQKSNKQFLTELDRSVFEKDWERWERELQ